MSKYFDVGANLTSRTFTDVDSVVRQAIANDVKKIVVLCPSLKSCQKGLELSRNYNQIIYCAVGIHPRNVHNCTENTMDNLEFVLADKNIVAIGEIGLDYKQRVSDPEDQKKYFRKQLDIAVKWGLPVILYERDAFADFSAILNEYTSRIKGVINNFTGNIDQLAFYINYGLHIGISQSDNESIPFIPRDKLLIGTNAPYCNIPANMSHIVTGVAREVMMSRSELESTIYWNAIEFFGL